MNVDAQVITPTTADKAGREQLKFRLIGSESDFPKIEFPAEDLISPSEYHWPTWRIQTCKGDVEIEGYFKRFICRGCTDALIAAGFIRLEWLPGIPGNNVMRQSVLFNGDGAQLITGNRRSASLRGRCLTVVKLSKSKYEIEIQASKDEADKLRTLRHKFELTEAHPAIASSVRTVRTVPKCHKHGNIICWPGRGNVAPVTLQ